MVTWLLRQMFSRCWVWRKAAIRCNSEHVGKIASCTIFFHWCNKKPMKTMNKPNLAPCSSTLWASWCLWVLLWLSLYWWVSELPYKLAPPNPNKRGGYQSQILDWHDDHLAHIPIFASWSPNSFNKPGRKPTVKAAYLQGEPAGRFLCHVKLPNCLISCLINTLP